MKKFLVPLFLVLFFSCSNDGFESDKAASAQKDVGCWIIQVRGENQCKIYVKISENLCIPKAQEDDWEICPDEFSSSSSEDEAESSSSSSSSSSRARSSSSSLVSSSSSVVSSSSAGSSSSSLASSSSSAVVISSSSSLASSSSSVVVSSSSAGSSSSSLVSSSSSVVVVSSSSVGVSSSSLGPAKLSKCPSFPNPYYVAKTNPEDLTTWISLEGDPTGCSVSYTLTSGSSYASLSSSGGNTFINFTGSASSTQRQLTVKASLLCEDDPDLDMSRSCPITVVIADKFKEIKTCDDPRTQIGPGKTTVEISVCTKSNFGCDCKDGDWNNSTNMFTINGVRGQGNGCWATAPIPPELASKPVKRVLIDYTKEIGCVIH